MISSGFSWNLSVGQEIESHSWIPSKTFGCRLRSGPSFCITSNCVQDFRTSQDPVDQQLWRIRSEVGCGMMLVYQQVSTLQYWFPKGAVVEPENIHLKLVFNVWNHETMKGRARTSWEKINQWKASILDTLKTPVCCYCLFGSYKSVCSNATLVAIQKAIEPNRNRLIDGPKVYEKSRVDDGGFARFKIHQSLLLPWTWKESKAFKECIALVYFPAKWLNVAGAW